MAATRTQKSRSAAPAPSLEPEAVERAVPLPASNFRFEAWPTEFRVVTQWFGARPEFYAKFNLPGHEGIDFVAPLGSKIFAVAAGTVKRVQTTDDGKPYGIHVRIQHVDGYETIYGHFESATVALNAQVAAGQLIGYADSTGNSSGSHLHLTLKHATEKLGGYPNQIVDPTPFVKALLEMGKNAAAYIKDLIPDGTQFQPGEAFEQRWTIRNTGTTAWSDGYSLAYLSGDRLGGPPSAPVPSTNPGGLAEVKVDFQAPATPGKYRSVWQMLAPAKPGDLPAARFGERMWVDISVAEVAVPAVPKELFEAYPDTPSPVAAGLSGVAPSASSLADIVASFEGMAADQITALLPGLPLLAGLEVILQGFAAQLSASDSSEHRDKLIQPTVDRIIALQERLALPK